MDIPRIPSSADPLLPAAWRPDELEQAAARALPDDVFGFIAGGADDEMSLARNRSALQSCTFRPRVLARSATPDCGVDLLGCALSAPVVVAPMGMQRLVHPDGELATAAAAKAAGVGFTVASGSSVALEEVAGVAGDARWFQLYLLTDRGVTKDLVDRAVAADYTAIVLTVDVPVVGDRPGDHRSRFASPTHVRNANFEPYSTVSAGHHAYVGGIQSDLGWDDVEWLVHMASGVPVVVKGILRADDAVLAVEHGASAVVVSNHGGRQLGRAAATIDVLPEIVAAVPHSTTVLLDGGVRTASDVVTALALGADAVMLGRLVMWSLAVGGESTVTAVLRELVEQLRRTMTLLGARSLADLPGLVEG